MAASEPVPQVKTEASGNHNGVNGGGGAPNHQSPVPTSTPAANPPPQPPPNPRDIKVRVPYSFKSIPTLGIILLQLFASQLWR